MWVLIFTELHIYLHALKKFADHMFMLLQGEVLWVANFHSSWLHTELASLSELTNFDQLSDSE